MPEHAVDLPIPSEHLQLHNGTREAAPGPEYVTGGTQWSYALSLPIALPAVSDDTRAVISVRVRVVAGHIGVGILDASLQRYISPETDVVGAGRDVSIDLTVDSGEAAGHLMIRNTGDGSAARFRLVGLTMAVQSVDRRLLIDTAPPPVPLHVHASPPCTGIFDVLVSHSSRKWNAAQCEQAYLRERYARPGRLEQLPPFESLPPNTAPYFGLLSMLRVELSPAGVRGRILNHYRSDEKIVHAAIVGSSLVVCFDAGLAVVPVETGDSGLRFSADRFERITDPWFGGLHTVMAADDRTCLVSSSGADAILWVDLADRKVVRRWRLPAERYGDNYPLTESTDLREHYIPNDLQLGHLNCATPDGHGGAYYSVLGQGDIGHVDASGTSDTLVSGYVGCHGVRFENDRVYFSESCTGRLIQVQGHNRAAPLYETGSRWLHDSVHLADGVFLLALGDANRLVLVDGQRRQLLAEWDFAGAEGTVQFLSVVPPG